MPDGEPNTPPEPPLKTSTGPNFEELSDIELAKALQPIMRIGDAEYIPAVLDVEGARQARARVQGKVEYRPGPGSRGIDPVRLDGVLVPPGASMPHEAVSGAAPWSRPASRLSGDPLTPFSTATRAERAGPLLPFNVIGTDARLTVVESRAGDFPYRATVQVGSIRGDGYLNNSCSGFMVHQHTAISAAHCFFTNEKVPFVQRGWIPDRVLSHGVVTRRATSTQWETYPANIVSQYAWLAPTACFGVSVHPVWMEELAGGPYDPPFGPPTWSDIAVIDFDPAGICQYAPGSWTGYTLPGVSYVEYKYGWYSQGRFVGYDGRQTPVPPGVNTDPTLNFAPPTILERTEYGAVRAPMSASGDEAMLLLHAFDTVNGSSGSGLRMQLFLADGDTSVYFVGQHTGGWTSSYCPTGFGNNGQCNRAPRFTGWTQQFLQDSSQDF